MAINNCTIMGRITRDPELRTAGEHTVLNFSVAVDRNYTDEDGEREADYISCVAWNGTAEFISKYFSKGSMIAVTGWLQSGSYEDDNGSTHYTTTLVVQQVSFTGERRADQNQQQDAPKGKGKSSKGRSKGKPKTSYSLDLPF